MRCLWSLLFTGKLLPFWKVMRQLLNYNHTKLLGVTEVCLPHLSIWHYWNENTYFFFFFFLISSGSKLSHTPGGHVRPPCGSLAVFCPQSPIINTITGRNVKLQEITGGRQGSKGSDKSPHNWELILVTNASGGPKHSDSQPLVQVLSGKIQLLLFPLADVCFFFTYQHFW